jgi:hypothetical protein
LDDVYSVSYSFWFRFSTQTPQKLTDLEFLKEKNRPVILARAFDSEIGEFDQKGKERMLAVYI